MLVQRCFVELLNQNAKDTDAPMIMCCEVLPNDIGNQCNAHDYHEEQHDGVYDFELMME